MMVVLHIKYFVINMPCLVFQSTHFHYLAELSMQFILPLNEPRCEKTGLRGF